MRNLLMTTIVVLLTHFAFSQQISLSGSVADSKTGEPLAGVTVYLPQLTKGTATDLEGKFSIQVNELVKEIQFSYVGYNKITVNYTGQASLQVKLSPDANLEEVIITAFRVASTAPVAQTTVERADIEKVFVGQDVPYVIEKISPSIISYSESGTNFSNYGLFRLRGIDQTRINITMNGAPLNDMIDQGVFFSNFTDLSNNVESVQIQRGVGTSTNGTASFAGSVGFESVSLNNDQPSAEAEVVAGSFNTFRGSAYLNTGRLKNNWALSSRFTSFTSDGYRNNTGTQSKSFYGSAGYFGDKDFVKITGFIGRSKNGLGYLPVALSDIQNDPKTNYLNENDRDDFGQWFIQALHTHAFSEQLSLASNLYYGGAEGDYFFTYDNGNGGLDQINYPLRNDHIGLMSNINYTSTDNKLNLYGGIHLYTFRRTNWEQFMPDVANPYYTEASKKDELSFFAKADYALGKLKIYGDLQFRTLALDITPDETLLPGQETITKTWNFLNPKIGLSYEINQNNSIYASFGRNGREPTKVDLFGGFQLNASNLPQVLADSVKAEYVNDFEAGINFSYPWLTGQVNAFYMQFENEIAPIGEYVPEGFLQLRQNMPESYRTGIEAALRFRAAEPLYFDVNATYMTARIKSYSPAGDQTYNDVAPALTPEFMAGATVNYEFTKRFTVSLSGRYVGESFLEPTNNALFITPSFFVADAGLTINLWGTSRLEVFVNNIFDEQYFTFGAPVDLDFDGSFDEPGYFVQPPRNFYSKLIIAF